MKKFLIALIIVILLAAPAAAPVAAEDPCGGTNYIVQPRDTLTKIADLCRTTVADLLLRNPQITNPNLIYTGQVIRISGSFSSVIPTPSSTNTSYGKNGIARVTISTTRGREGDHVTVEVTGFPANSWIDYRVGQEGKAFSVVYDGIVNARGSASQIITLPADADKGEYWVVVVTTTSQRNGVAVTSQRIYIDS